MKLTTWNINSVRTRVDRIIAFLERSDTDVLAMQETKCRPDQFPVEPFQAAGYEVTCHGINQWNGVAIASRIGLEDIRTSFPGQPAWGDPEVVEPRALAAVCGGVEVWSLYIPNGRAVNDPHYHYKLAWLKALGIAVSDWMTTDPGRLTALVGDWNVAPTDQDVWDINQFADGLYVSTAERDALAEITTAGTLEVTRPAVTNYTFWDYQKLRFPRNQGMRIDYIYATPTLAKKVTAASIDREERKGKGASDHVPVTVDISN